MANNPEKLLPIYRENNSTSINLHLKDGNPVKTDYVVGFLLKHSEAVELWKKVGLMRKTSLSEEKALQDSKNGHSVRNNAIEGENPEYIRRLHNATEHMVTVAVGANSIARRLEKVGILSSKDVEMVAKAALVHDALKETEYWLARWAQTDMGEEGMRKEVESNDWIDASEDVLKEIWSEEDPGIRGQIAYDYAGSMQKNVLRNAGFDEHVIDIQAMVAHASCLEIEMTLEGFDNFGGEAREKVISMLILHYMDDIVTNPNIIEDGVSEEGQNALEKRMNQNINNPAYGKYNEAWKKFAKVDETAFDMQLRVGQMVENKLAELLGVEDPITLPSLINSWIKEDMVA